MTDTQTSTAKGLQPTRRIYSVSGEGKKAKWTEIGAAWPNKDGQGFSIICEAMPLNGRLAMRAVTEPTGTSEAGDLPAIAS